MRRCALIVLLLPSVGALADAPAEELARWLGDPDPLRRRLATSKLVALGPKAWPALEPAARSDDPEVSARARRILRAWAWIPPRLRPVLDERRLRALLGDDPEARRDAAEFLRTEAGALGRAALEYLFAAPPATFRIEEEAPRRTHFDLAPRVLLRLRNVAGHPGWAPPRLGVPAVAAWRPFGRPVKFPNWPANPGLPMRFRSGGAPPNVVRTTVVAATEWVAPGALARTRWRVVLAATDPGVATFSVGDIGGAHPAGRVLPHMEDGKLVHVANGMSFVVPFDLGARRITYNLLPAEAMWGVANNGSRVEARRDGERIVLRLSSDFAADAPPDFGSAWFVALDRADEVVAHGPLDGADADPRRYAKEDLVRVPRPPDALERAFPLPRTGPEAVRLLVGAAFSRGRRAAGYTAVAKPIDLP